MRHILRVILAAVLTLFKPILHPYPVYIEQALKSVGHIEGIAHTNQGDFEYGCSAFSIAPRKYLTADHCIGDDMTLDGVTAVAVQEDAKTDLAVILVDDVKPSLVIRQTSLTVLEPVTGLGYGYSWDGPTPTENKVYFLHFSPAKGIYPGIWFSGYFILGMSGGPVIDRDGQVVAVVQRTSGDGTMCYGVDAATIQRFLDGVMQPEK